MHRVMQWEASPQSECGLSHDGLCRPGEGVAPFNGGSLVYARCGLAQAWTGGINTPRAVSFLKSSRSMVEKDTHVEAAPCAGAEKQRPAATGGHRGPVTLCWYGQNSYLRFYTESGAQV